MKKIKSTQNTAHVTRPKQHFHDFEHNVAKLSKVANIAKKCKGKRAKMCKSSKNMKNEKSTQNTAHMTPPTQHFLDFQKM